MGFIRAALSAGLNSFNDSKFKEAIVLPDNVSGDALAVKGQLLTKDPDGRSRHSNQNTGLLSDGSVVIVPQGYTAILVNNGTFLGEVLEAGSHEWQASENAWLFEKGGVKGTWDQFKNRFSFGGQVVTQQEIIFVRMQPFTGNKFGTQNPVEYFSDRYQQLLSIRFYGLYDVKVADPVLFGPFEQKRHGIRPLVRWLVFHLGFLFVLRHRMRPSLLREKVSLDLRHTSITPLSLTRRKRRKIPEEPAAFAIALPRAQPYEEDLPVRMCSKPAWKKSA